MKGLSRNLFRLTGLPICTAIGLIATAAHAKSSETETSKLSNAALDQALAIECADFLSSSPSRMAVARMAVQAADKAESKAVDANALNNATASKTAANTQMNSIAAGHAAPEAMKGVVNSSSLTLQAVSQDAANASTALSTAMRAIRNFETEIETGGLADNDTVFNGNLDRAVEARKKLASCAKRNFEAAKKAEEAARVAAPESAEAKTAKVNLEEAQRDYIQIAQRSIFDQAQLSLLVGPSFTINGSDKFNTGAEISALFDGGAGSFFNFGRVITGPASIS